MKGWIAFNDSKKQVFKIKASAINGVGPAYKRGFTTILVHSFPLSVEATEEEVFKAIEMATLPPLYMVDRSNNVTKIEE